MSDSPDTEYAALAPDDKIYLPDINFSILKEDYDILKEVFSKETGHGISARTGNQLPAYFLTRFFSPQSKIHDWRLQQVAHEKAKRLCERDYPQRTIRHMDGLYDKGRSAFVFWWTYLEDEENAEETDEESAMEIYVTEFIETYDGVLYGLDRKHPENLQEHHEMVDKHVEFLKGRGKRRIRSYEDYSSYYRVAPRWQQNIAADGRSGGAEAAEEDADIGMGYREGSELKKLAEERFTKLWDELSLQVYFENQDMFDFMELRRIYVHNFMRVYAERSAGGQGSGRTDRVGARIVSTHLEGDSRVYLIEIRDSEHLDEPAQVEVSIQAKGAPE